MQDDLKWHPAFRLPYLRQLFINSIQAWGAVCNFVQLQANSFRLAVGVVLAVLRFISFIKRHAHHLPALYEND
jgi:hypothetical protein